MGPDAEPDFATIAGRVLLHLDEVAAALGAAYTAEVPEYEALGRDVIDTEVVPTSRAIVDAFFAPLQRGEEPDPARLDDLRRMGRRRLEMGVGLEPMLHVYRIAARTVWERLLELTPAAEAPALAALAARWMEYMDRAASVAAASYLDASTEQIRRLDARRDALVSALLDAEDATEVAALATTHTTTLAARYLPVVLAGPDPASVVDRVVALTPHDAVVGLRGTHVVALVADPAPVGVAARLAEAAPASAVVAGHPERPGPDLRRATSDAGRIATAASGSGSTGLVSERDFLEAGLVATNPRLAARLVEDVIEPVRAADRSGQLLTTLRRYFSTGSVPRTAEEEFVHVNTVGYRLKRIRELTGLDPRVPDDATLLHLALTAEGIVDPTKSDPPNLSSG